MSTKRQLIEAASRVILTKGVNNLTLNAVAEEAKVSKGGLLYHYGTKDALIIAMNQHVIEGFHLYIQENVDKGYTYHKAYLHATLEMVSERTNLFDITTSLLAAIATNHDVLNLWREEYNFLNKKFAQEDYSREYTLLVKSVCDGLWFSKLFHFNHMSHQDEQVVISYLLDLIGEGGN